MKTVQNFRKKISSFIKTLERKPAFKKRIVGIAFVKKYTHVKIPTEFSLSLYSLANNINCTKAGLCERRFQKYLHPTKISSE